MKNLLIVTALASATLLCTGAALATEAANRAASAPSAQRVAAPGAATAVGDREAKPRAYFTDTVLTTHDGRKMRFYSDVLKDHVVLIGTAYTSCEDACPLLMYKLVETRRMLGERFGKDVRFVTIMTDPARDTPAAVAAFVKKYDAEHPEWLFLTGSKANLAVVLGKLGVWTEDHRQHFTGMIVGNVRADHWKKIRPDAPPRIVAAQMLQLADEDAPGAKAP